jgi:predicted enzyme related to lactoylglutathione lyase
MLVRAHDVVKDNEVDMAAKKKAKKPAARAKTAKKTSARRTSARRAPARVKRQQPESLRLRAVAPSLTVNDLDRSLTFYRDVMGFVVKDRWENDGKVIGVEMLAGSVSFYLNQDDWKKGRDRVKGEGFRLFATTAQDVDAMAAQVKTRGGHVIEEPHDVPWGGRSFGVADPDGYKITIYRE